MMEVVMDDSVTQGTIKSDEEKAAEVTSPTEKVDEATPDRPTWLPGKFKTPEAFGASYENLEREFTKNQQELSDKNKLIDEYLLSSLTSKPETQPVVDYGSLSEHGIPGDQIGSLISQDIVSHTAGLQAKVDRLEGLVNTMSAKTDAISMEPDFVKYSTDAEFINWANKSFPESILQQANVDAKAVAWLIGQYKERFKSPDDTETTITDVDTDRQPPATGSGKGGRGTGKKVWSRTELTKLRAENPTEYQRLHNEIMQAYREGRVK